MGNSFSVDFFGIQKENLEELKKNLEEYSDPDSSDELVYRLDFEEHDTVFDARISDDDTSIQFSVSPFYRVQRRV